MDVSPSFFSPVPQIIEDGGLRVGGKMINLLCTVYKMKVVQTWFDQSLGLPSSKCSKNKGQKAV